MVRGVASGALFYALLAKGQPHACVRGPSGDIVNLAEGPSDSRAARLSCGVLGDVRESMFLGPVGGLALPTIGDDRESMFLGPVRGAI